MRCDLDPTRVAVWWCKKYRLRLSAFAAQVLIDDGKIKGAGALKLHRVKEYDTKWVFGLCFGLLRTERRSILIDSQARGV